MRTSKVSQVASKIFQQPSNPSPSSTRPRRSARQAAKTISAFALVRQDEAGTAVQQRRGRKDKDEEDEEDEESEEFEESEESGSGYQDVAATVDIEDTLMGSKPASTLRKRKRGSPAAILSPTNSRTITTTSKLNTVESQPSSRKERSDSRAIRNGKVISSTNNPKPNTNYRVDSLPPIANTSEPNRKAIPKIEHLPARKVTLPDGTVKIEPPSNWETMYELVKQMRRANPTAPVDTMGCESLHWPTSPPHEQRFHTLCALMLSSQTKDTVTAAAMHRLHTQLVPVDRHHNDDDADNDDNNNHIQPPPPPSPERSHLTIPNLLSTPPAKLTNLLYPVGFHNVKTRNLIATASTLLENHSSDVPDNLDTLLTLPGVGPKMALLTLAAAWGQAEVGIAVDVHVHRITNMWGWHLGSEPARGPEETRRGLEAWLPRDRWHEINGLLVGLGQTVCLSGGGAGGRGAGGGGGGGGGREGVRVGKARKVGGGARRRCGECVLGGTGLCRGEIKT